MPDTKANSPRVSARDCAAEKKYRCALAALAVLLASLQAASLTVLRDTFWGTHLYAFLPLSAAIAAWTILGAATLALLRRGGSGVDASLARGASLPTAVTVVVAAGATASCTALFWILRSRQTLLGDAVPLMIDLPDGKEFHPRQPFAMWIQQQLYRTLGKWFRGEGSSEQDVAGDAVALGSVAAGALLVGIAIALGRALARGAPGGRATPWLAALVLLAQGYIVLVFGYIENYSYYLVAIALYLLCALLYLERRAPLAVVAVSLSLALGVHLSSMALAPSFLFLLAVGLRDRERRADGIAGALTLAAGALVLDRALRSMAPEATLGGALGEIVRIARTSQGGGAGLSYMFSPTHIRDFASELVLIGPVGSLLVFPAAAFALADRRLRANPTALFLLVASACYLAGNWVASEPLLGYARDWDLFAPAGVCYCATTLFLLAHHAGRARVADRLLAFSLVLSLVHVVPWVWINHSEAKSIERFATLPLRGGRTETALGNHYFRKSDYASAEVWFQRALAVDNTNPNANSLLGRLYGLQGNYESSAEYLRRAVAVRPDKASLRRDYVVVLLQIKRCREALPHLLWLVQREPDDVNYWQRLGETMVQAECTDELVAVYEPLLDWLGRYAEAYPADATADVHAGMMLERIGRREAAVERFRRALSVDSTSAMALYGLGTALYSMGESEDARRELEKFLELYPDHPQSDAARAALAP